jgi:CheY-like chemotaxis protein
MRVSDIGVLLVDDDEMIRDCITAYLEDEGLQVFAAASAKEGLQKIAVIRPNVCISDMNMPGMNGEEFIKNAFVLSPQTAYLLHTGMFYSLSAELLQIGMTADDVLLKPIHDLAQLSAKIKRIALSRRG